MVKQILYSSVSGYGLRDRKHAIVIGSGIAGLAAGRVLADHFEKITIIERDSLSEEAKYRSGVPQSHHAHALLTQGQRNLERLFPGLEAYLSSVGALQMDWGADLLTYSAAGWMPRFLSGLVTHVCSRELLEYAIRRYLTRYKNVQFLDSTDVVELESDPLKRRIIGVNVRSRKPSSQPEKRITTLKADLTVDACGRFSRSPQWLKNLGFSQPQETVVKSFRGYASRWYERPAGMPLDWKLMQLPTHAPHVRRGGVLLANEGNSWIATLVGAAPDYPPGNEEDFLRFAQSLESIDLYAIIKDARVLSPIYKHRRMESRWRHYEHMPDYPEGFIIVGDAVCALNPVYVQGMSISTFGALTLDKCLRDWSQNEKKTWGFALDFQKRLSRTNFIPWLLAISEDLRWSETVSSKTSQIFEFNTRVFNRYMDQIIEIAAENIEVRRSFLEVWHLINSPITLAKPGILFKVLTKTLFSKL